MSHEETQRKLTNLLKELQEELPTCARCGKPVDSMSTWTEEWMCYFAFRIECHGESEVVKLAFEEVVYASAIYIVEAFREQKAEAALSGDYCGGRLPARAGKVTAINAGSCVAAIVDGGEGGGEEAPSS